MQHTLTNNPSNVLCKAKKSVNHCVGALEYGGLWATAGYVTHVWWTAKCCKATSSTHSSYMCGSTHHHCSHIILGRTIWWVANLSTHNQSTEVIPTSITHCSPSTVHTDLNSSNQITWSSNNSNSTIWTQLCRKWNTWSKHLTHTVHVYVMSSCCYTCHQPLQSNTN